MPCSEHTALSSRPLKKFPWSERMALGPLKGMINELFKAEATSAHSFVLNGAAETFEEKKTFMIKVQLGSKTILRFWDASQEIHGHKIERVPGKDVALWHLARAPMGLVSRHVWHYLANALASASIDYRWNPARAMRTVSSERWPTEV